MVKLIRILSFASLLLIMFACKKNTEINDYATIYPRSYFPVYPGSYWKYSYKTHNNNQTSIHTWTTSGTYRPHRYYLGDGKYSTYVNVPFLNEDPIYGYQKVGCGYAPSTAGCGLYNFLSEDTTFVMYSYFGDPRYNPLYVRTILFKKTIDEKNDSVLIFRGNYEVMVAALDSPAIIWTIYKKNVGKVLEYEIDTLRHDTIYKQVLLDYFVNFKK